MHDNGRMIMKLSYQWLLGMCDRPVLPRGILVDSSRLTGPCLRTCMPELRRECCSRHTEAYSLSILLQTGKRKCPACGV